MFKKMKKTYLIPTVSIKAVQVHAIIATSHPATLNVGLGEGGSANQADTKRSSDVWGNNRGW